MDSATQPSAGTAPRPLAADRTDRRRWLQLVCGVVAFVAAQLVISLTSGLVAALGGARDGWNSLAGALVGAAAALALHRAIVRWVAGRPGLTLDGPGKLRELIAGLGLGAALMAATVGVVALLGGYRVTGVEVTSRLITGLAVGIGPGVVEEILFRGYLVRLLDAWVGSWWALALSSALFGLAHVGNPQATLMGAAAIAIEAGILLGAAYLLTRRLWLAIGIHAAWNYTQSAIFGSAVSGTGRPRESLLDATITGPEWLTGGAMGLEGSAVAIAVCGAAGVVMVVLARRRGRLLPSVRRQADVGLQHALS